MNRRETLFGLLALGIAPRNTGAQQPRRTYRVGFLFSTSAADTMAGPDPVHPTARAFVHAMRNLGYRGGQNLDLQNRSLEGKDHLGSEIMAEMVRHNVEVIVAAGNPAIAAASRATSSIPIVMVQTLDPVGAGFIASLARPGGNVTGFTADTGPNTVGKQLGLLQEALPRVRRVAYAGTRADWASERGQNTRAAARVLGLNLFLAEHSHGDYSNTFTMIERERADGLITSTTTHHFANRNRLAEAALKNKVPSMATWSRDLVDAGCLMSYAMDPRDNFRRAAIYVDRILKGTRPGDLPVEQPVKFELVINLKTARALGVTIATSVLLRADDVIQ